MFFSQIYTLSSCKVENAMLYKYMVFLTDINIVIGCLRARSSWAGGGGGQEGIRALYGGARGGFFLYSRSGATRMLHSKNLALLVASRITRLHGIWRKRDYLEHS
jgi:hypothetical protein